MLSVLLTLKGLRWRTGASVTVFALALIAVFAATTGPIYLHAADQRVLSERLEQAAQTRRDVLITEPTQVDVGPVDWAGVLHRTVHRAVDPRWFAPPTYEQQLTVAFTARAIFAGALASVSDACAHVRIVSGRCVTSSSTSGVMVSSRMADASGLHVGDTIAASEISPEGPALTLDVVGVYRVVAADGPYWTPWSLFHFGEPPIGDGPAKTDALLAGPQVLSSRLSTHVESLNADLQLEPGRVSSSDTGPLTAHIAAVTAYAHTHAAPVNLAVVQVSSELSALLQSLHHELDLTGTLVTVATLQLTALAVVVLYAAVAGTSAAGGPEIALAKLRGRRRSATAMQGVLAPVLLVLCAAPVGVVLAWLAVKLIAPHLLGVSAPVVAFPLSAIWVGAAAAGGGILAALVAARRILSASVAALLSRTGEGSRSGLGLVLFDAAAAALALAGLLDLLAGGAHDSSSDDPLSPLAPTLLAVAGAIVVLRLLPFAGRTLVRTTRDSRRLATFLAVRQLVRRPSASRSLVVVAIAASLAAFALVNWSVARNNRHDRALNTAGADTVFAVSLRDGVDLRTAVDRADPGGHSLAAAYVANPGSTGLLAVDAHRFAGIGAWVPGNTARPLSDVLHSLVAGGAPSITFSGDRLRLVVDLTTSPGAPVHLTVDLVDDAGHELSSHEFGTIHAGTGTYTRGLDGDCVHGCRVTGLSLSADTVQGAGAEAPRSIDAAVSAYADTASGAHAVTGFADPARWRSDGVSKSALHTAGSALAVALTQPAPGTGWASLQSADVPADIPAVVASGTAAVYPGQKIHSISSAGLDDGSISLDGIARAVTVPELDRTGVMVDLGYAQLAQTNGASATTRFQVWVGPNAPADLTARLAQQGVRVTKVVRAAQYQEPLDHAGPAFAAGLYLVAAVLAIVLAIAATVLVGALAARRRGYELAALRVVGLAPRALRRSTTVELAVVLLLGLLVGVAAGVGGAALALPHTPFFVDESVGPPPADALPWGLIGLLVAALLVVLVAVDLVISALTSRQAGFERLREAP